MMPLPRARLLEVFRGRWPAGRPRRHRRRLAIPGRGQLFLVCSPVALDRLPGPLLVPGDVQDLLVVAL